MGGAKRMQVEQDEQGWSFTDSNVCSNCVDDYALEAAIVDASEEGRQCDFCGRCPAAPLDALLAVLVRGLLTEYGDANDEGVIWESREGGYQWDRTWDTWDLIGEFGDALTGNGLLDAVRAAVHDRTWVERNFAHPRREEALSASWERFCEAVQYETRYVFWLRSDEDVEELERTGDVPAARILAEVGMIVERLGLVRTLPAGTRLWRGREHDDPKVSWGALDLGTAPRDAAKFPNRMSPAGIPMFYGSSTMDTAIREVAARSDKLWITVAVFATSAPCLVVDFTSLPGVPSLFDAERAQDRAALLFIRKFVGDLRKPPRPLYEAIDYVPTQVVTEYLLRILDNGKVAGLLYASALTDDPSVVLDVPQERCIAADDPQLRNGGLRLVIDSSTITTVEMPLDVKRA